MNFTVRNWNQILPDHYHTSHDNTRKQLEKGDGRHKVMLQKLTEESKEKEASIKL